MNQMNNPLDIVYAEMQRGADLLTALDRAAAQYPQAFPQQKVIQAKMVLGGNCKNNLEQVVRNMAQERGTTLENVLRSMGVTIPSQR